jgi:hypothetical protein
MSSEKSSLLTPLLLIFQATLRAENLSSAERRIDCTIRIKKSALI